MTDDVLSLLSAREGHFRYESGYHAGLWLELDPLFVQPRALLPFLVQLAGLIAPFQPDAVCGPITGGALVAMRVAEVLGAEFYPTERKTASRPGGLFPVAYPLPASLRDRAAGKRVAVLDDVISAGSAVRGSADALRSARAEIVAVGALLVLGDTAPAYFAEQGVLVVSVAQRPNPLWQAEECPLCAAGIPLEDRTPEGEYLAGAGS